MHRERDPGVRESQTAAIWGPPAAALERDDAAGLSPPGFDTPAPDGRTATVGEYRDWLVRELESFGAPVASA
jgi:hypothetical protein